MKNKIYLCGPISGYNIEERKATFSALQVKLENMGYKVCNPFKNGLADDAETCEHMRFDIKMLVECDTIYLMKGWTHSAGCRTEFQCALSIGLTMAFEDYTHITTHHYTESGTTAKIMTLKFD